MNQVAAIVDELALPMYNLVLQKSQPTVWLATPTFLQMKKGKQNELLALFWLFETKTLMGLHAIQARIALHRHRHKRSGLVPPSWQLYHHGYA